MLRLAYNEVIQKHSDISARLADINLHFAERIKAEFLETFQKINAATLLLDKVKLYQDWLKFFSQRRIEDVNYAMEAAQVLSSTEMKLLTGLGDKEDLQAANDLAPKFYPILISPWLLDLPGWAAVATGAGAEPSAQRSARSRRGRQVKANSDGVFHPSCECGRASL